MEVLWDWGEGTVREVWHKLGEDNRAYTTVMTAMDRLFRKGLLVRAFSEDGSGNAYQYKPVHSRAMYWQGMAQETMRELMEIGGDVTLSAFVEVATDIDEQNLERLEALVRQRRKERDFR